MNVDDIITCKSYEEKITDFQWHHSGLDIPASARSVWVPIEQMPDFIKEHGNDDQEYNIVSSCSDIGVTYQKDEPVWFDFAKAFWLMRYVSPPDYLDIGYRGLELAPRYKEGLCKPDDKFSAKMWSFTYSTFNEIPKSFKKWFMVNMSIYEPNVQWIPFGAAPKCEDKIVEFRNKNIKKDKLMYVNFQISQEERWHIQRYFQTKKYPFVTFKTVRPYEEYLQDLGEHKFCLCPPGNGMDSYRIWEALYMRCIPVVPYNRLTRNFTCFPMVFIDFNTWMDVFANLNDFEWERFLDIDIDSVDWDIDELKLSYWRDQINV